MISFFRSNRRGVVGVFIVIMCALLMLPFGVDYFGNSQNNQSAIATVNGGEISVREYDRQLYGVRARLRQQFGENFPQIASMLNLKQKVLDDMIDEKVLNDFFTESNFGIGLSHVEGYIKTLPIFADGVSRDKLLNILKAQGISERQFENDIRNSLLREQLNDIFLIGSVVSKSELKKRYIESRQKITVAYLKVNSESGKIDVSDEEIQSYYKANEQKFMTSKSFKVSTLKFPYSYYESKVVIHDEDLEDAYKNQRQEFEVPAKVQLEQLVFNKKVPEFLGGEVSESKNIDILAAATRTEIGSDAANFKKIGESKGATYLSDSSLKELKLLPSEVQAEIENLKENDISKVIESESAFYIVKVNKYEPGYFKPIEEVKTELEKIVRQQLAPEMALFAAQEFKSKLAGIELEKAKEIIANTSKETKFENKEYIGDSSKLPPEFSENLESQNQGEVGTLEQKDGLLAYYIAEVVEPKLKPLDEVKSEISKILKNQKQIENDKILAKEIIVSARNAGPEVTFNGFNEIAKKKNLVLTEVSGSLNDLSLPFLIDEDIKRKMITQVVSSGLVFEPIIGNDNLVYLMVLKNTSEVKVDFASEDWKKFIEEEQMIVSRRLETNFIRELKKKSKIEVNDQVFDVVP